MNKYEKACRGEYLQKYGSNGNLLREAEKFPSGSWVVWTYSGKDISGEYTDKEFASMRKYF